MGQFRGQVTLVYLGPDSYRYQPVADDPLAYTSNDGNDFVLDESFDTDMASTPRLLWSVPGYGPDDYLQAALVHDWLFARHHQGREILTFRQTNALLEEMVRSLGGNRFRAFAYRVACDLAGWPIWHRNDEALHALPSRLSAIAWNAGMELLVAENWGLLDRTLSQMNFGLMSPEAIETWLTLASHPDVAPKLEQLEPAKARCREVLAARYPVEDRPAFVAALLSQPETSCTV